MYNAIRLYQPTALTVGDEISLSPTNSHHLITVLRTKVGRTLTVFNGEGGEYTATLLQIDKRKNATISIDEFHAVDRESPLHITLAQSLAKPDRMDYCIQKAVELGVHAIELLITENTQIKFNAQRWGKKQQHWQQTIISASQQSGRQSIPPLSAPQPFATWIAQQRELIYLLAPEGEEKLSAISPKKKRLTLAVGPESGFSAHEIKAAKAHCAIILGMGPRILRTETAGPAAIAALQTRFGDY